VESVTVVRGRLELRVHRVVGAPPGAVVEQTGWATGPGVSPHSALHPLHGWSGADEAPAPQGTAFTPWARVPRLTGEAEGTSVYASLATLTAEPEPVPLAGAVTEVSADAHGVEVRWADDGSTTRVTFAPLAVGHTGGGQLSEPGPESAPVADGLSSCPQAQEGHSPR
jgi:hypothetical protein